MSRRRTVKIGFFLVVLTACPTLPATAMGSGDAPAIRVSTGDLSAVYKALKSSPLGVLYANPKVKAWLQFYAKPMGIDLATGKNKPSIDALDRLLSSADGPARLAVPRPSREENRLPAFVAVLGTTRPAQAMKDAQTVLKSAPTGSLEEKAGRLDGKNAVTYVVKTRENAPAPRFPFARLTFVEAEKALWITNLPDDEVVGAVASANGGPVGPTDGIELSLSAGSLRSLIRAGAEYVPAGAAEMAVTPTKGGLTVTAKFPGADREAPPLKYLGTSVASVPRPPPRGAHTEMAALLNLGGIWDAAWAAIKKRSAAEYFAFHATLLEFEKGLGVKVADEIIPALEGSAAVYGSDPADVIVFAVADEGPVKRALKALAAMGGAGAAVRDDGVYEIAFGDRAAKDAIKGSVWYARLAGRFLALSTDADALRSLPASVAAGKASGPFAATVDVPGAYAAYFREWQGQSIAKKRNGPAPFPPALLSGKVGALTVQSSNLGGDLVVVAELKYAKGK